MIVKILDLKVPGFALRDSSLRLMIEASTNRGQWVCGFVHAAHDPLHADRFHWKIAS